MHADLRMTFEGVARVCQHQLELLVLEIIVTFDHHTTRIVPAINAVATNCQSLGPIVASQFTVGKQTKFNYKLTTMSNFL